MRFTVRIWKVPMAACMLACAIACVLLVSCGGEGVAARFAGTWDLQYGMSPEKGDSLSAESVQSMRALGVEAYLNLDENGSLALVTFDAAQYGSWKPTGESAANATVEGQSANIVLSGDELRLVQADTTLVFSKGDPKASDPVEAQVEGRDPSDGGRSSAGLSEEVVKGALLDEPVVVADDEICTIVIDGTGVDRLGDPGLNLQIANNHDTSVDVWTVDPFKVGGQDVAVYLFETIEPGGSATAFMQFDVADMKSVNAGALMDVEGVLLVDDDANETIATYPFKF